MKHPTELSNNNNEETTKRRKANNDSVSNHNNQIPQIPGFQPVSNNNNQVSNNNNQPLVAAAPVPNNQGFDPNQLPAFFPTAGRRLPGYHASLGMTTIQAIQHFEAVVKAEIDSASKDPKELAWRQETGFLPCIERREPYTMQILLDLGGDPNGLEPGNPAIPTPLQAIAAKKDPDHNDFMMATMLLSHAKTNVSLTNAKGKTARQIIEQVPEKDRTPVQQNILNALIHADAVSPALQQIALLETGLERNDQFIAQLYATIHMLNQTVAHLQANDAVLRQANMNLNYQLQQARNQIQFLENRYIFPMAQPMGQYALPQAPINTLHHNNGHELEAANLLMDLSPGHSARSLNNMNNMNYLYQNMQQPNGANQNNNNNGSKPGPTNNIKEAVTKQPF